MKLLGRTFPKVKLKDGSDAPDEIFRFIIASYGRQDINQSRYYYQLNGFDSTADAAADLLSYDSLCDAISALSNNLDLEGYPSIIPVLCRFGNREQIKTIISKYTSLRGVKGTGIKERIKKLMAYNSTKEAILWLEKMENLKEFARIRNITVDEVYENYLFDFGFDENGRRVFCLGTSTLEIMLSSELTFVNAATKKGIRSIPKKGADPELYKQASDEFADMKATLKKAAKQKNNQLYEEYLEGSATPSEKWQNSYLKNPFLRAVARLLVWSQGNSTFTVTEQGVADAAGQPYKITDEEIKVAHPMEMKSEDIAAWQKYFVDNKLKQPFIQIWESVADQTLFEESRYANCNIRSYYLNSQEKKGIIKEREYFTIKGFDVEYKTDEEHHIEITRLKPKNWNRRTNTVIAFLDRITVYGRIKKDDISIMQQMERFTLAQIMEFIKIAQEGQALNVTAALLQYKQDKYPDFDPLEEFTLDF